MSGKHNNASAILACFVATVLLAAIVAVAPAKAQPAPPYVSCPQAHDLADTGYWQNNEIRSDGSGSTKGTIILRDEQQALPATANCLPQLLRFYQNYEKMPAPAPVAAPLPGPTIRAQLGDVVQLTFLNQIDTQDYGASIDQGEKGSGCDQFSVNPPATFAYPTLAAANGTYPAVVDTTPDCFHGSSTGNLHFHGTHTNPASTGDNVFIGVRPSPRVPAQAPATGTVPVVTDKTYDTAFETFFSLCRGILQANPLADPTKGKPYMEMVWFYDWFYRPGTLGQKALLQAYDAQLLANNPNAEPLWPVDHQQINSGLWPQYYMGAYPYCFVLPKTPPTPGLAMSMGQAPGTQWYHAHKHGSTALNVSNGMAGAFIIEGAPYDGALTAMYGTAADKGILYGWTRRQPTLVVNQLGSTVALESGGGQGPFSVNGVPASANPTMTMYPGEVKLWRIVNASSGSGFYFPGLPNGFQWMQVAQDGVQFPNENVVASAQRPIYVAAGNRIDLLVRAPTTSGTPATPVFGLAGNSPAAAMAKAAKGAASGPPEPQILFTVNVTGSGPVQQLPQAGPDGKPKAPLLFPNNPPTIVNGRPAFLKDIGPKEVTGAKVLDFNSANVVQNGKPVGGTRQHTIALGPNGPPEKFGPNNPVTVKNLNTVEEWTISNTTTEGGGIDHPFHIHINPFQIVEVFAPNAPLTNTQGQILNTAGQPFLNPNGSTNGTLAQLYVIAATNPSPYINPAQPSWIYAAVPSVTPTKYVPTGQCWLNPADQKTWVACKATVGGVTPPPSPSTNIWWDVFPIPAAAKSGTTVIPGHFKMRTRFVDYAGSYVLHCHILAHEDRGMMRVVVVGDTNDTGGSTSVGGHMASMMYQHH